ncbi:FAD-dependent pyridine nucleotide-disulphide oxidoreductase [Thermocrinis albus DSM 14484]|uniref:FAD-dependent pyridine nucleotide-disulphide oxidoreductase n=1 Tax=Thermocrinis albus (strain DSM 14484 / JCM 11386 / HI 11/12) TaxID=638303 RepID=D3SLU8_THEAH|nr:FAD-dependent oxidoreductase [Thermocrinis albus]ADC89728.1 FAD-dependent pyridine nucleotide-disulphide oxidoreductase [Thermocrinis albus DSM 14484]
MMQVVIIGGGPAGISASIYAARKKMNFLLVTRDIGGQVMKAGNIENYLGYAMVDGVSLVERMIQQMERLGIQPILDQVVDIKKLESGFQVITLSGKTFTTKTVLLCTGSEHRRLNVPGEAEYVGRGVSYCYTCDAPFFKDSRVLVVGGGNSGFEAADQLLQYASKVYLTEISDSFRADEVLREKVLTNPKVTPLLRHRVLEIRGDTKGVRSVILEDLSSGNVRQLEVEGVFVEIGLEPNTELASRLGVLTNSRGEILVDCNNRTSELGIYAAGDCTNIFAKQIVTAAGDGAKALLSIYHDLTYGVSNWI